MNEQRVGRRAFLRLSGTVALGSVLAACGQAEKEPTAPPATTEPTTAPDVPAGPPERYSEAPEFAAMVEAGTLPPVTDRLPAEPQIVVPVERVGEYGGMVQANAKKPLGIHDDSLIMGIEGLLRTDVDGSTVVANIAKSWEFSDDGTEFTLYLREGLRWSDGELVTADDIMFWYEDIFLNTDLTPAIGRYWKPGGEPIRVVKVDDYTVTFVSIIPNPEILSFGGPLRGAEQIQPKHYLKQFHPNYVDVDEIIAEAKAAGYETWYQYFGYVNSNAYWGSQVLSDRPTLCSYVIVESSSTRREYRRNPYAWKVDTAGNQLPYFDGVLGTVVTDVELANARVVAGEVDYAYYTTTMENYPMYKENAEDGDYKVAIWHSVLGSDVVYQPAQTYEGDLVLRDIFRDKRFRQALSLAINRDEVNEVLYFGMGRPRQFTLIPESMYSKPEFEQAYAEYDLDKANALLDEMDLEWDADHKFRLRSDGKKLAWTIEFYVSETPKTQTTELVVDYWREIGCDVSFKEISAELDTERYSANMVEMGLWHGDKATDVLFPVSAQFLVPYSTGWETTWGTEWARWYTTEGAEGEEPPEEIKNLQAWWEELKTTVDKEKRIEIGQKILQSQAENLWVIGVVGCSPKPVIFGANMRNVPEDGLTGWDVVHGSYRHPEQYFFEGGKSLRG